MAACTVAPLSCGALACLTLSMHQSPQDGAGGGCTSSSDAVAEASTLMHHGKHKRGMWRHMRSLHDLGMAHTFHTAVPHTSAWPHPNAIPGPSRSRRAGAKFRSAGYPWDGQDRVVFSRVCVEIHTGIRSSNTLKSCASVLHPEGEQCSRLCIDMCSLEYVYW